MKNTSLFTDASVSPGLKVGVGGYLLVPDSLMDTPSKLINISELEERLVFRRFEDTSSTTLEVQTVLWALEDYCKAITSSEAGTLHLYTDSQCVDGLLSRRSRLEKSGFHSRGGRGLIKNASLYRQYYQLHDQLTFDVTKVKGHTSSRSRNTVQFIFSFIDKNVRKALKQWVDQVEAEKGMWSVYMIRCGDGTLYTGISNDVARRFENHQETGKQGAKYLRGRGPLELVFQKEIGSKSLALKMEQKLKKVSKSEKELIVQKGDID